MSKPTIPPRVMRDLRFALPPLSDFRNYQTQADAAKLLGVSKRTVARWELEGAPPLAGWAYVGVAYRVSPADELEGPDGPPSLMLQRLVQLHIPGFEVPEV